MVSIFTKVGVGLFAIGIILTFLVVVIHVPIPFIIGRYGQSISMEPIPINGSYVDIQIPGSYSHPFSSIQLTFKITILGEPGEEIWGNVKLLYSDPGKDIFGELNAYGDTSFYLNTGGSGSEQQSTFYSSLSPKYASSNFILYLRFKIDPMFNPEFKYTGSLYLKQCEMEALYTAFASVIPPISALIGSVICVGGFIMNYRKLTAKPKPREVPGGWEPSLKMGTAFEAKEKKAPKMAIKPTETKKIPTKKVAKKVVSKGGPQQACKYCGKSVSTSAFFCPHCYGKLR
ncbi:MAG: hypothetical protein ACFFAE_01095 [Candidatus Hodarchaeota archaeon]